MQEVKQSDGILQIGIGRAADSEPESGEPIFELRLKWLGDGRGPVRINGKSSPAVALGVVGQEPLAAILAASRELMAESD